MAELEPVLLPLHYAAGLRALLPAPVARLVCGGCARSAPATEGMHLRLGCGLEAVAAVAAAAAAEGRSAAGGPASSWAQQALLVAFSGRGEKGAAAAGYEAVPLNDTRALRAALRRCGGDGFVIAVSGGGGAGAAVAAGGPLPRAAVAFLSNAGAATRLLAYEAAFRAAALGLGLEEAGRGAGAARAALDEWLRASGWETDVPKLDEEGVRVESIEVGLVGAPEEAAPRARRNGSASPRRR